MKVILFFLFFSTLSAFAAQEKCSCKCVVKDEDAHYTTLEGTGDNRELAGEDLKKKLKKQKCELSPVCQGGCY